MLTLVGWVLKDTPVARPNSSKFQGASAELRQSWLNSGTCWPGFSLWGGAGLPAIPPPPPRTGPEEPSG